MNQVIFANRYADVLPTPFPFAVTFTPVSSIDASNGDTISDCPNEDFIIQYRTYSNTIKTIEVNRETLSIQKINLFDVSNGGEYYYEITITDESEDLAAQIIRQDAVPHQRNSWYIELDATNPQLSFYNQLKVLAKSDLLGITNIEDYEPGDPIYFHSNYPLTIKGINCTIRLASGTVKIKSPYQYLQMLLTKHVQNFGYNHTDDNAELNSGLADYKAWIAGTESDSTVAVYRLRFATNRKASKTRDERVWQNVYICTKGENNRVASLLDEYIAILNGEETEGGE